MPDGLITPELVLQVGEATRDYVITPTEFTEIMGTISSIFVGAAVAWCAGMLVGAVTERFARESGIKSSSPDNIVWSEIDPNIRWVVREFRRRGHNTISSCEGHLEDGSPTYIAFKADKDTWDKIDQMGKKYFEPERLVFEETGTIEYTRWFEGHPANLILYNDMTIHIELWPPMPPLRKGEVMSKESWIKTADRFWHWIFEILPATA